LAWVSAWVSRNRSSAIGGAALFAGWCLGSAAPMTHVSQHPYVKVIRGWWDTQVLHRRAWDEVREAARTASVLAEHALGLPTGTGPAEAAPLASLLLAGSVFARRRRAVRAIAG
jgi:hypothetical protein